MSGRENAPNRINVGYGLEPYRENYFVTVSPCGEMTLNGSRQELSTTRLTLLKSFKNWHAWYFIYKTLNKKAVPAPLRCPKFFVRYLLHRILTATPTNTPFIVRRTRSCVLPSSESGRTAINFQLYIFYFLL